mgnify:CR=1 FL=1
MLLYYIVQGLARTNFIYYNIVEVITLANKDLKTRTPISNAIDTELLNKLKAYSKETGIPISKLLDKSISLFLESTKK